MPLRIGSTGRANVTEQNSRQQHPGGELQHELCRTTGDHVACLGCDCTCHPREARDWARRPTDG